MFKEEKIMERTCFMIYLIVVRNTRRSYMTKINYGEVMQNFREEIEALSKKDKKGN